MAQICCRLCLLQGPDLLPIPKLTVNSNSANESTLPQLIVSYLSIETAIEGTTETYICSQCRNTIVNWHRFRESCLQNDGVYRKMAYDPGKDDEAGQIDEYHAVEVKQEIEIGEHEFSEDMYTEPQDEGRVEKEGEFDEEKLIEPMDPPPTEMLNKKGEKRSRVRTCTLCGKEVKDMANHMRMHNQDRCYQCPHCPMSFHIKSNLKKHVNVHTKEIKYNCPVCTKLFLRSDTLKAHMRIHSDQRPFKCQDCPRAFRFLSGLGEHRKTHKKQQNLENNHPTDETTQEKATT